MRPFGAPVVSHEAFQWLTDRVTHLDQRVAVLELENAGNKRENYALTQQLQALSAKVTKLEQSATAASNAYPAFGARDGGYGNYSQPLAQKTLIPVRSDKPVVYFDRGASAPYQIRYWTDYMVENLKYFCGQTFGERNFAFWEKCADVMNQKVAETIDMRNAYPQQFSAADLAVPYQVTGKHCLLAWKRLMDEQEERANLPWTPEEEARLPHSVQKNKFLEHGKFEQVNWRAVGFDFMRPGHICKQKFTGEVPDPEYQANKRARYAAEAAGETYQSPATAAAAGAPTHSVYQPAPVAVGVVQPHHQQGPLPVAGPAEQAGPTQLPPQALAAPLSPTSAAAATGAAPVNGAEHTASSEGSA